SNAVWTPHRDPREPDVLDLPSKEEVLERPQWPDIISNYVGSPLNVKETRDTITSSDSPEQKERKKFSPFRDEGYVGYERKDDGKYEDDDGNPLTAEQKFQKR